MQNILIRVTQFVLVPFAALYLLLFTILPPQANADGTCTPNGGMTMPTAINYGEEFEISITNHDAARLGNIEVVLTISGPYEGFNYTETLTNSMGTDVQAKFLESNDKIKLIPPGLDSDGNQVPRSYKVFAEYFGDSSTQDMTCEGEITILPSTSDDHPPITNFPEIPISEREEELSNFKVEAMNISRDGKSSNEDPNNTINGNTHEVRVTFTGLTPNESYKLCLQNDQESCYKSDDFDLEGDDYKTTGSTLVIPHLCGAGDKALKKPDEGPCDPDKDYFHEGKWYTVGLYSQNYRSGPLTQATFYVSYAYPHVFIPAKEEAIGFNAFNIVVDPGLSGIVEIENPFDVSIVQYVKPGKSQKDRNNYQIVLESSTGGHKVEKCVVVEGSVGSYQRATKRFSYGDLLGGSITGPIPPGEYLLKINEQNNENDWKTFTNDDCQGGFTYYHIPISVQLSEDGQSIKTFIDYSKVQKDPNRVETQEINEQVNHAPLPCAVGIVRTVEGNTEEVPITDDNRAFLQECTKYATAFGPIGLTPLEFINSLGTWLLAIGSVAAIIFMVYSGYIILTSRGDKEKIGNAREILTSAVTGLIFIILSITILEIIGVDILRIPGWER